MTRLHISNKSVFKLVQAIQQRSSAHQSKSISIFHLSQMPKYLYPLVEYG